MRHLVSSVLKTAITTGLVLQIAQGMDSTSNSHLATASEFTHNSWAIRGSGSSEVTIPGGDPVEITFNRRLIPTNLISEMEKLKPTCSILMNNGAQIDYVPGVAALWVVRDYEQAKQMAEQFSMMYQVFKSSNLVVADCTNVLTNVITGEFDGKDLYSYSTEEFANILINTQSVMFDRPVHVTFSDTGEFPIKHPADVYTNVTQNWLG